MTTVGLSGQLPGPGPHRALDGSMPVFGSKGKVENYPLLKIEINVAKSQVRQIVDQLRESLGWEEPLVNVFKIYNSEFDL